MNSSHHPSSPLGIERFRQGNPAPAAAPADTASLATFLPPGWCFALAALLLAFLASCTPYSEPSVSNDPSPPPPTSQYVQSYPTSRYSCNVCKDTKRCTRCNGTARCAECNGTGKNHRDPNIYNFGGDKCSYCLLVDGGGKGLCATCHFKPGRCQKCPEVQAEYKAWCEEADKDDPY